MVFIKQIQPSVKTSIKLDLDTIQKLQTIANRLVRYFAFILFLINIFKILKITLERQFYVYYNICIWFYDADIISEKGVRVVLCPTRSKFSLEAKQIEEWMEREVNAIIDVEYDQVNANSSPLIIIGDKKLSWKEFGKQIETFEGWRFDFKLSSIPPR